MRWTNSFECIGLCEQAMKVSLLMWAGVSSGFCESKGTDALCRKKQLIGFFVEGET